MAEARRRSKKKFFMLMTSKTEVGRSTKKFILPLKTEPGTFIPNVLPCLNKPQQIWVVNDKLFFLKAYYVWFNAQVHYITDFFAACLILCADISTALRDFYFLWFESFFQAWLWFFKPIVVLHCSFKTGGNSCLWNRVLKLKYEWILFLNKPSSIFDFYH